MTCEITAARSQNTHRDMGNEGTGWIANTPPYTARVQLNWPAGRGSETRGQSLRSPLVKPKESRLSALNLRHFRAI